MAIAFPFPNKITINVQNSLTINEVKAAFGDGYAQVGGKGIKPVLNSLSLVIAPLSKSEMISFEAFIYTVGTWNTIALVPPFETAPVLYKLKGAAKKTQIAKELWQFAVTLQES